MFQSNDLVEEIENSHILHWNYRNFSAVPPELRDRGKHITDVYLKGNNISALPNWFISMECLTELYFSSNKLSKLPEQICCLKNLVTLDVSENNLYFLPDEITKLKCLEILVASHNSIEALPQDLADWKKLWKLDLSFNKLKYIPNSIIECINLEEVNFEKNCLTSLPSTMVYLEKLKYLSVKSNKMLYMPLIPFTTNVVVMQGDNELLNYLSYMSTMNLYKESPSSILENGECRFSNTYDNYSKLINTVIKTEIGSHIILPFPLKLIHPKTEQVYVQSLYEIALKTVIFISIKSSSNRNYYKRILPSHTWTEINLCPTCVCEVCYRPLFFKAIARVYLADDIEHQMRVKYLIVAFLCSLFCSENFQKDKVEKGFFRMHEIDWEIKISD